VSSESDDVIKVGYTEPVARKAAAAIPLLCANPGEVIRRAANHRQRRYVSVSAGLLGHIPGSQDENWPQGAGLLGRLAPAQHRGLFFQREDLGAEIPVRVKPAPQYVLHVRHDEVV